MVTRKPLIKERHLYRKPERKHAKKIRSVLTSSFVFFFIGGWWMQSAGAQTGGKDLSVLINLPIDRWSRFIRPNIEFGPLDAIGAVATGGVGGGVIAAISAAISNFFYAVTNTIWDITFNIVSLGFSIDLGDRAGNTANKVTAILGDLFFRTGVVWMILIFAVAYIFYMVFKGASTSVIRIALATLLPLGLLFFSSSRAVQQESIQRKIDGGTATVAEKDQYNQIVGSPKWFLDQGVRLSNMPFEIGGDRVPLPRGGNLSGTSPGKQGELGGEYDPFAQLAITNYYGEDQSWQNFSSCADYVQQLHNRAVFFTNKNRVVEGRVKSAVSTIWERAVLIPWINSEFGSGNDFGKAVFCHKLETDAGISIQDRWSLFHQAWPGSVQRPPGGKNVGDEVSLGQLKRLVELIFNEGDDQAASVFGDNELRNTLLSCLNDAVGLSGLQGFVYRQTAGRIVSAALGGDCVEKIKQLISNIEGQGEKIFANGAIPRETFNLLCDAVDAVSNICPGAGIGRDRNGSQYTNSEKVYHINNKCRPADIAGTINRITPKPNYECIDKDGNSRNQGNIPERLLAQITPRSREGMRENLVAFAWCRWDKTGIANGVVSPDNAFDKNFSTNTPFTLVWGRSGSDGTRDEVGLNEQQACNQWWDFGNFNPKDRQISGGMFAFNDFQIGSATTANGNSSTEVANFLYSINGGGIGGGIAGVVSSLITVLIAWIYFFSLGAMAFAVLLAQIQLVLVFAMAPAFLLIGAFPHPRTKGVIKVMLRMMATGLFAKAAAVLILSFFILITILLTALIEGAFSGLQVRGTFGSVWSAIVPLFVIFALKKIPAIRNMMTFRGAFRSAKQRMKMSATGGLTQTTPGTFGRQMRAYGRSFGNSMSNLSPHSGMAAGHRMRNRLSEAVGSVRGRGIAGAIAGVTGAHLPNAGAAGAGAAGAAAGGAAAAAGALPAGGPSPGSPGGSGGSGGAGGRGGAGGQGGPGGKTLVNSAGLPVASASSPAAGGGVLFNAQGKAMDPKTGKELPAPPAPTLIMPGDPENKGHATSPKGVIVANAHQFPKEGRQGAGLAPAQGEVDRRKQEAEQIKLTTRDAVGEAQDKKTPSIEVVRNFKKNEEKTKELLPPDSIKPGAPGPEHAKDSAALYGDLVGPKSQEDAGKTDWQPGTKEEVRFPIDPTDNYATPYGTMSKATVGGGQELYLPASATYVPPPPPQEDALIGGGDDSVSEARSGYGGGYYPYPRFAGSVSIGGGGSGDQANWNTGGKTWKEQFEEDKYRAKQDLNNDVQEALRMRRENENEIFQNEMKQRRQRSEEESQLYNQRRREGDDEFRRSRENKSGSKPLPSRKGDSSSLDGFPKPERGGGSL